MKKTILLLSLILLPLASLAQDRDRCVSVIPHAGLTISRIDGDAITVGTKWKTGWTAGAGVDFPLTDKLSILTGVEYSLIGTGLKGDERNYGESYSATTDNMKINVGYVSVPLQLNTHIYDGLSFNFGIEAGFLVLAKAHADVTGTRAMDIGSGKASTLLWENFKEKESEDVKDNFRNIVWSIPVGLSYEWRNIVLNASYRFEIRKAMSLNTREGLFTYENPTARNHAILVTLGYRFRL